VCTPRYLQLSHSVPVYFTVIQLVDGCERYLETTEPVIADPVLVRLTVDLVSEESDQSSS